MCFASELLPYSVGLGAVQCLRVDRTFYGIDHQIGSVTSMTVDFHDLTKP